MIPTDLAIAFADRVVAGHHDHLDAGGTTLGDGVRHGGPGRVDHRHQAHEPEPCEGEVHVLPVEGEAGGEGVRVED